jgi:hypothetical protein
MGKGWETWTVCTSDQVGSECVSLGLPDIQGCRVHLCRPTLTRVGLALRGYVGRNWKKVKKGKCEGGGSVA